MCSAFMNKTWIFPNHHRLAIIIVSAITVSCGFESGKSA
jgi:hypothetical protein